MAQRNEYPDVATKIRKWSRKQNPNISFGVRYPDGTTHSLRAMADDEIDFDDLLNVLKSCRVTDLRLEGGEWRHNAEGKDKRGRELVFVVILIEESEELEIVTAWAVK
jgi:hypothetical protein